MGQIWANLSEQEKQTYQEKAAEERERVAQQLQAWQAAHAGGTAAFDNAHESTKKTDPTSLEFPTARIRKICKLDPEVRGISKEALWVITKAAELFTVKLGSESTRVAQIQNRRKLLPEDVVQVCDAREPFRFLQADLVDLVREQKRENLHSNEQNEETKQQVQKSNNPLTAYFAVKPKNET